MKFAQYLQNTQTPEWKKAYIDYRGLKKRITAIRKAQQGLSFHVSPSDTPSEGPTPPLTPRPSDASSSDLANQRPTSPVSPSRPVPVLQNAPFPENEQDERASTQSPVQSRPSEERRPSAARRPSFALASLRFSRTKKSSKGTKGISRPFDPLAALPLHELLTQLSPHEVSFFTMLDAQLDKVESFYVAREKEMLARGRILQIQLRELQDHRKLFHEAHRRSGWLTTFLASVKVTLRFHPEQITRVNGGNESLGGDFPSVPASSDATHHDADSAKGGDERTRTVAAVIPLSPSTSSGLGKQKAVKAESGDDSGEETETQNHYTPTSADPDNYLYAKSKLKKAVLEYYRGLEVLHNYRILNITGFRKALKKFEKVTKIPAQSQYMNEKVERSAFASDKSLKDMMMRMEEIYAVAFASGDKKKAVRRLRSGNASKNHHYSTFRTGMMLGLAIPALVDGLVKVFQEETREEIPAWSVLLFLYSIMLIPVLFTLLLGFNLLVWARARINYVFIFELEVLSRLDHREYFEIPGILLCTLCYAFWLSFSRIGSPSLDPSAWPLVWLGFTIFLLVNPLPVLFRSSRFWLIRNVAGLFMSGTKPVEFTDFWLGDQFCSLIFTISNLFLFVCVYVDGFSLEWQKCANSHRLWPLSFALASLPLFIRLVQSIKRFVDSSLSTHLINGGKYGSGIVAYFFYFLWRHHGSGHDKFLALWIFFNTCYSLYAGTWDLLMDWSLLKVRSKNRFLRDELVYTNHTHAYYFAIVSNIIIRFIWIIYIPTGGLSAMVRTFIGGFLEMLRRWQWNFFRLENEHLGNMDQYRATREVPLPYSFDQMHGEGANDDDDDDDRHIKAKSRR